MLAKIMPCINSSTDLVESCSGFCTMNFGLTQTLNADNTRPLKLFQSFHKINCFLLVLVLSSFSLYPITRDIPHSSHLVYIFWSHCTCCHCIVLASLAIKTCYVYSRMRMPFGCTIASSRLFHLLPPLPIPPPRPTE